MPVTPEGKNIGGFLTGERTKMSVSVYDLAEDIRTYLEYMEDADEAILRAKAAESEYVVVAEMREYLDCKSYAEGLLIKIQKEIGLS